MNILFLIPYPLRQSPSQRFRFEQYFELLKKNGFKVEVQSFLNEHGWKTLYQKGNTGSKIVSLLLGYLKRFFILFKIGSFDFIFIHRETAPLGPPFFEWIIGKVLQKKIIYDFDDAIWQTDKTYESSWEKVVRWRHKVRSICRWSFKISCGNQYLCDYATLQNSNVVLNPTTIDTLHHQRKAYGDKNRRHVTIGWTGTHSTLKHLMLLTPVLQKLELQYPNVKFLIIADKNPELPIKALDFIRWSAINEIEDLLLIDIGIMPLPDDDWSKGKCGFKALQYMALQIPAVVSPVGINGEIVSDGVNGFLCSSEKDWFDKLALLINSPEMRQEMGIKGRLMVEKNYSVASNESLFLSLFE